MIDTTNELYQRIDEVLHYIWDPIGVRGAPQARDEYYGYLPEVWGAVIKGKRPEDLAKLLNSFATTRMGLSSSEWLDKRTYEAVEAIFNWAEHLKETQNYVNDKP